MNPDILQELEHALRILAALGCGLLLGHERESHMKVAGIRTHAIVALASSLMMVISKYGFFDVLTHSGTRLDPSRVAAGIVTAIGFLGAGVIFTRKLNVSGLTTAAGIWATVGIGMAFGAGMYVLGLICTFLLLIIQYILHINIRFLKAPVMQQITLVLPDNEDLYTLLATAFPHAKPHLISMKIRRTSLDCLEVKCFISSPTPLNIQTVTQVLKDFPQIKSIEL